jgi:hypothetical protein
MCSSTQLRNERYKAICTIFFLRFELEQRMHDMETLPSNTRFLLEKDV